MLRASSGKHARLVRVCPAAGDSVSAGTGSTGSTASERQIDTLASGNSGGRSPFLAYPPYLKNFLADPSLFKAFFERFLG